MQKAPVLLDILEEHSVHTIQRGLKQPFAHFRNI